MQLMTSSRRMHSLHAWHSNVLFSKNTDKIYMECFINWNFERAGKYLEALLKNSSRILNNLASFWKSVEQPWFPKKFGEN